MKNFIRRSVVKKRSGEPIYKINGCGKGIGPILDRNGSKVKKRETVINDMAMTPFGGAVVFGCMRWCGEVRYPRLIEKRYEFLEFTPIVGVERDEFCIEVSFY